MPTEASRAYQRAYYATHRGAGVVRARKAAPVPAVVKPGARRAVFIVVVEDSDKALAALTPLVERIAGVAWDLSASEATRVVEGMRAP